MPDTHPLLQRQDVVLSPHSAAGSTFSIRKSAEMTAQNILDFFDGKIDPDCVFNWSDVKSQLA